MSVKPRKKSKSLKTLECLNARMELPVKEKQYFMYLKKGYEGELYFDELLSRCPNDWIIVKDLLLEVNNSYFQIDTLLITGETVYLFEIKNYEGDFFIKSDSWYSLSGIEIKNPYFQLKRSESLFRRMLQNIGYKSTVEAYLIFVNPEFTLYETPLNVPFIFPTQLNRFLQKLQTESLKLNKSHRKFAKQLLSRHINEPPVSLLPAYDFTSLKKGITCASCHSFLAPSRSRKYICKICGYEEKSEQAIIRNIEQFKLLFPNKKVTTNVIYEWCEIIHTKKTIQRILSKKYQRNGRGKASYYTDH